MEVYTSSTKRHEEYVRSRDGGICVYCKDAVGQELDHVIPVSRWGKSTRDNLVLACTSCNMKKLNRFDPVFLAKAFIHLVAVGEIVLSPLPVSPLVLPPILPILQETPTRCSVITTRGTQCRSLKANSEGLCERHVSNPFPKSKQQRDALEGEIFKCQFCGKDFKKKVWNGTKPRKYCSHSCATKSKIGSIWIGHPRKWNQVVPGSYHLASSSCSSSPDSEGNS